MPHLTTSLFLRKHINRLPYILLCIICFFPLFKVEFISKLLFLFFSVTLIIKFKEGRSRLKTIKSKHLLINTGFYFILVLTLFYTANVGIGLKTLIRQLSLFLFPVMIFYFLKPSKHDIVVLGKIFVMSNISVSLYLIAYVLMYYDVTSLSDLQHVYNEFNFRSIINEDVLKEWHPGYVGWFILGSIFILIEGVYHVKKWRIRLTYSVLLVFLSVMLFLLNSRGVLYGFILITPFYFILKARTRKSKIITILICITIFALIGFIVMNNYSLNYRLMLQIEKIVDWIATGQVSESGIDSRYYINQCNLKLFTEKPFFGYGIGDIQYHLNNCYLDNEFFDVFLKKFNSHSVFFYLLFCGGVFGLLPFLILIFHNIKLSYIRKDFLYMFLLLLFCIVGISENFLVRLNGILFFSLTNTLLYYNLNKNNML